LSTSPVETGPKEYAAVLGLFYSRQMNYPCISQQRKRKSKPTAERANPSDIPGLLLHVPTDPRQVPGISRQTQHHLVALSERSLYSRYSTYCTYCTSLPRRQATPLPRVLGRSLDARYPLVNQIPQSAENIGATHRLGRGFFFHSFIIINPSLTIPSIAQSSTPPAPLSPTQQHHPTPNLPPPGHSSSIPDHDEPRVASRQSYMYLVPCPLHLDTARTLPKRNLWIQAGSLPLRTFSLHHHLHHSLCMSFA